MNAGFHSGLIQKMCGAGSVPSTDFGENLTFLVAISSSWRRRAFGPFWCSTANRFTALCWRLFFFSIDHQLYVKTANSLEQSQGRLVYGIVGEHFYKHTIVHTEFHAEIPTPSWSGRELIEQ